MILAGALLSITLNPLVFRAVDPLTAWLHDSQWFTRAVDHPRDPLTELPPTIAAESLQDYVVIVGYGWVGRVIGPELERHRVPYLIVEQNREYVVELRQRGLPAIYGDAAVPGVLEHAHLKDARLLAVATPDALLARQIIELARTVNPTIDTVVRTHSDEGKGVLERMDVGLAVMGETELAHSMVRYLQRSYEKGQAFGKDDSPG